jgi:heat shock 70kDa protein 4
VQRLLGTHFDSPFAESEAARLTAKVVRTAAGGIAAKVAYGQADDEGDTPELELPFEALAGMLFSSFLGIASNEYKAPVRDCVVTVPGYYTEAQRRAVLDAGAIGNVNILRVANEHAAIALSYGIFRTKELPEAVPVKVAFVDVGAASTTVFIAAFTNSRADILSVAMDANLGGRDFDLAIANVFAGQFKESKGIDAMVKPRAKLRLLKEAEKVKKVLSANAQAPANVECLVGDDDFKSKMSRDDFQTLTEPLIARIRAVCERAIADAGLEADEKLLSVEIVGACTRVPAVKDVIGAVFEPLGAALKNTLNMDECVARGAALMSAMLSPAFKVRDYAISDVTPYAIEAQKVFSDGSVNETLTLVPKFNTIPCIKAMTFKAPGPLTININYNDPAALCEGDVAVSICSYTINAPNDPEAKVRAKVRITANGTIEIAGALMSKEVEVVEDAPAPAPPTIPTTGTIAPTPASDAPEPTPVDPVQTDATAVAKSPAPDAMEDVVDASVAPTKRVVKKTINTDLVVTRTETSGVSLKSAEVAAAVEREAEMKASDLYIKERMEAMNGLEGYVYDLRSRIDQDSGDLAPFGLADFRDSLKTELDEAEEWIYSEEGEKASKSTFVERKNTLAAKAKPMLMRKREADERPVAIRMLESTLDGYKKLAVPSAEEYAHIDQFEKDKALKCVEDAAFWLKSEVAKQDSRTTDVDPTLTYAGIMAKAAAVSAVCGPVVKTPKPAPVVEEKATDPAAPVPTENGKDAAGASTDAAPSNAEAPMDIDMEKPVDTDSPKVDAHETAIDVNSEKTS